MAIQKLIVKVNFGLRLSSPSLIDNYQIFKTTANLSQEKHLRDGKEKSMPRDTTAIPRDAVGMPPKISKDKISKDNKGGVGEKKGFIAPNN